MASSAVSSPPRSRGGSGAGTCLALTLSGTAVVVGADRAVVALGAGGSLLFAVMTLLGILWNVITVSLRQTIIPPHLLGRVNSVYRFFAWGMMPIGAAIGGLTVVVVDTFASRDWALRATWLVCAVIHVWLFVWGRATLTTERSKRRGPRARSSPTASGDATP